MSLSRRRRALPQLIQWALAVAVSPLSTVVANVSSSLQEPDSRLWPYVYPNKYSEAPKPPEEDRWKDDRERERDRKGKEERPRQKESLQKEEVKEGAEGRTQLPPEEHRGGVKETRPPHMHFSSPLAQHQGYMPYMHGPYYSHGYEPSHPGYRGMPSVMLQNYPGKKKIQINFISYI